MSVISNTPFRGKQELSSSAFACNWNKGQRSNTSKISATVHHHVVNHGLDNVNQLATQCRDAKPVRIRRPCSDKPLWLSLHGSLSSSEAQPFSRPLVQCIMIRPAIEVGWHDILLARQSGYLRTMIDGVVDGLDQHDDDRSII